MRRLDASNANNCSNTIPVTLTVTDECGNPATCVAMVTIEDNLAPILTCPTDQTINLAPGECGAIVNFIPPFATDNCEAAPVVTQTSGPTEFASGDEYPIGEYNYTYEAVDGCGNVATCSFNFFILENVTVGTQINCSPANASVDLGCSVELTAGLFLVGTDYGCFEDYIVEVFYDMAMTQPVPTSPFANR